MSTTKDTNATTIPIRLRGRAISIAAHYRPGSELILFLHGFGCTKDSFAAAFDDDQLVSFGLCAIDFPGHGDTASLAHSHDLLCDYAILVRAVVAHLRPSRVHLVCHSMGGAVGLLAAADLGPVLGEYYSVEGNLVAGDCGLISRGIAEQDRDAFARTGFGQTFTPLRSSQDAAQRAWGAWAATCDPAALHEAARSLVGWCDAGDLADIYQGLPRTTYVYGEDSGLPHHLEACVDADRSVAIAGSGHFPMIDNPASLWGAIAAPLRTSRGR